MKSSYGTAKYYEEQVAIATTREALIREAIKGRIETNFQTFNVDDMHVYADILEEAKDSVESAMRAQEKYLNEQKKEEGGDNE